MKVQIVDSSETLCKSVKEVASNLFEIDTYFSGIGAVERIHKFRPDILVLSTMLPGNDGFHILRTLQGAGIHPCVLMLTPLVNDYIVEMAAELDVSYMMCKPCNMNALVSCLCVMQEKLEDRQSNTITDRDIGTHLLRLGLRTNLSGYRYLIAAISSLCRDPDQSLTKEVYPAVGRRYNSSWQQIERGIRTAITNAFNRREKEVWHLYFPPDANGEDVKPTNSMFLTIVAERLSAMGSNR